MAVRLSNGEESNGKLNEGLNGELNEKLDGKFESWLESYSLVGM